MNDNEFEFYSSIAIKLFDYMNGRINILNSNCILEVNKFDFYLTKKYGNIRYPNFISINIGGIVDSWDDRWGKSLNKKDFICTSISWTLAHELHHADQLVSMVTYSKDTNYRNSIEADVERASYDWVYNNRYELSQIGGFNVIINELTTDTLIDKDEANYRRASVKEFYLQTIANIVMRDLEKFSQLQVFIDDNYATDIEIAINGKDNVLIKSNGRYLGENTIVFSKVVYHNISYYDNYIISAEIQRVNIFDNRSFAKVDFKISERFINPLIKISK